MVKGIDVSSNNDINISNLGNGYKVCYIKATEGHTYVNPKMGTQVNQARQAGMLVGFYHFMRSNSPEEEARFFKSVISKYSYDLKPALDIEDTNIPSKTDHCKRFIDAMGGKGKCIIYTYISYYRDYINSPVLGYDIWMASYGSSKPSIRDNNIIGWQYTDKGINGHTDVSEWYTIPRLSGGTSGSGSSHYNSHGILFVDGKAKGSYPGKNYHAKGTTQLYLDSTLKYAIDGSYLDDGEVCPMYLFSDGSALVEYRSNSGKCWKCGYVKYSEQLDNIW